MKRFTQYAVLVIALAMVFGCTAAIQTKVGTYNINGVDHRAAFIEGRGVHGATLSTINCYDKDGKLETNNAYGTGGILSSFVQGGLAGAEMGAGIGAGMAAQGAAKVVQNTSGGGATQSQGQGIKSSISSKNVNVNTNSNKNTNTALGGEGGTGIGIGGAGGNTTIQKGAVVNNNDVF